MLEEPFPAESSDLSPIRRDDILVVIPALNEERAIGSLVLTARLLGLPVLVVDDGSTDRTPYLARLAGAEVVSHERNLGKAEALNTAFRLAREREVGMLVTIDGDGQHDLTDLEPLLERLLEGEADIVIGSRFLDAGSREIPRVRRLGQRAMTTFANVSSRLSITDSQSGYRAFGPRAIERIVFSSRGFSVESEMQFLARQHGLKMVEVPIRAIYDAPPRRNVFQHGLLVFNGLLQLIEQHRPLLFFGLPGILLVVLGFLLGLEIARIYHATQQLAIGYGLLTILLINIGILAMFSGLILHAVRTNAHQVEQRLRSVALFRALEAKPPGGQTRAPRH
jgi:glycosyltransferase involved in cell wall biosynthesis